MHHSLALHIKSILSRRMIKDDLVLKTLIIDLKQLALGGQYVYCYVDEENAVYTQRGL